MAHQAEFEDAIAACNLLPGPASTQLAIFSAWRVAGPLGAMVGGVAFIVPGLVIILALAALFLTASPPTWILGAAAGTGAAVAAVAVRAGIDLVPTELRSHPGTVALDALRAPRRDISGDARPLPRARAPGLRPHRSRRTTPRTRSEGSGPMRGRSSRAATTASGGLLALVWVAFKVGALSYGGGFVIIPLMQADAVDHYHWMTDAQFLNAVALGQVTPGPVVQTVAVVGYAAAGIGGGLLAALVAFTPSFAFVLLGARHFDQLRTNTTARAFLAGAGPAAIGAILGAAVPLALALGEAWQYAVLGAAAVSLLVIRQGVVLTLFAAAAIGLIAAQFGAPLP